MIVRGEGFSIKQNIGLDDLVAFALLLPLTFLFTAEVTLSLKWRMVHDTPLLHYVAFLVDRFDSVVYRDVFETSMPGTFLFHLAIGKVVGYGDAGFRAIDLAWLGTLLAVTWLLMARFGQRVAWGSTVLFGLSYFQYGPSMSLQGITWPYCPSAWPSCWPLPVPRSIYSFNRVSSAFFSGWQPRLNRTWRLACLWSCGFTGGAPEG